MKVIVFLFFISLIFSYSSLSHADPYYWVRLLDDWNGDNCFRPFVHPYIAADILVLGFSTEGISTAELSVSFPTNVIVLDVIYTPQVSLVEGDIETGVRMGFAECQAEYGYFCTIQLVTTDLSLTEILLLPHPDNEQILIEPCGLDPIPIPVSNRSFLVNYCSTAVESSTWGTIKQLFK